MAKLISNSLESLTKVLRPLDNRAKLDAPEPLPAKFREDLKTTFEDVRSHLYKDKENLERGANSGGGTLDRATRESLAQDADLIQSYVERNPKIKETLQGTACRVDRVYGRGAQSRDEALMYGSVGLFAVGGIAGLAARGVASFGATGVTGLRVASARGLLTPNAARVLGVMAVQTGRAGIALGTAGELKDFATECLNKHQITAHAGTAKDRCENYSIKGITADNCYLSAGLSALGFVTSLPSTQKFLGRITGTFTRAEEVTGRPLSAAEKAAVQRAHEVGAGVINPNGKPAGIGNYTPEQLEEKAKILKEAGFDLQERRRLMEAGVVGLPPPPHDFRPANARTEFKNLFKYIGKDRRLDADGNEIISMRYNHPEFQKHGIDNLIIDQKGYAHVRKHFLTPDDMEHLKNARDERATLNYLREIKGKGTHTVMFGAEPERLLSVGLGEGMKNLKRLSSSKGGRGVYELAVIPKSGVQTRLKMVVCEAEVCDEFGKRGQIISLYATCGPSVYQIAADQALDAFRAHPGSPASALKPVPCK